MAYEKARASVLGNVAKLAETLALELRVAYREDFVQSRISGSRWAATANASLTYMPLE